MRRSELWQSMLCISTVKLTHVRCHIREALCGHIPLGQQRCSFQSHAPIIRGIEARVCTLLPAGEARDLRRRAQARRGALQPAGEHGVLHGRGPRAPVQTARGPASACRSGQVVADAAQVALRRSGARAARPGA